MAQAQGTGLAHIRKIHVSGLDGTHQRQQILFARDFQLVFQLVCGVKVVFYGAFIAPSHKYHVPDAGSIGFFNRVLNQGFVNNRQHFLRLGFGGGQKAGTQTRHWKNGFV